MPKEFISSLSHFLIPVGFQSIADGLWLHNASKVRIKAMPGNSEEGDMCIGEDQWMLRRASIEAMRT